MLPPHSPLFLSTLLIILCIVIQTYSQDQNTPFLTHCYGDSITSSSPYDSNLRRLISDLIASTPNAPSFFLLINSTSPQIFGLAQCRPDLSPAVCSACLNQHAAAAANSPPAGCALNKSGALRSGNCLLRYSDQMFYSALEEKMLVYDDQVQNASASFSRRVNILMKSVTASAAAAASRFAVGVTNNSVGAKDIYGMGWCSMDLASSDCAQCLDMVLGRLPAGKNRGTGGTVSCEVRFETYQFYSSYVIAPSSAPAPEAGGRRSTTEKTIVIVAGASGVALLLFFTFYIILLRQRKRKSTPSKIRDVDELKNVEIKMFDFCAIKNATNNFAKQNKLGQGGFGPVYKGVLVNGQEIAVKRLSTASGQGLEEMKNEIHFVAKLQHRNVVRLLGYCLEREEKLLVYELLPNTSLDKFLFDPIRRMQLDWETRFKIIVGIGHGLIYLHEDSHLRIVHRDLKASNILLDSNMNPKISDFGLAKLFGIDETERNTSQIAGTFGYMAPEYVLHGLFSTKSDVFSYGVLVLEIITGEKKNIEESEQTVDLLSCVWKHWKQGKALQVVDKSIGDRYSEQEAMRCLQIGLLCVQEEQTQRPNMALVVSMMLCSSSTKLPSPSTPAFYSGKGISVDSEPVSRSRDLSCLRDQ